MKYKSLLTILALIIGISSATAQNDYFFKQGERFDANIPTPEEFLGYQIGTLHTRHDAIVAYMFKLAELSDRVSIEVIGETYEHRKQLVLTITSPENHSNLESIRQKQ